MILALGKLHSQGIMHRDLKLENVLVDERGYLKLIDYGLAKTVSSNSLAFTMCGTAEYMAPEVVSQSGHDLTADWWSTGVLIFEMLHGATPFYINN